MGAPARAPLIRMGLVAVVLATPVAGDDATDPAKGKNTYARYCVACHGPNGRGDGPLARDLRVHVPDLTALAARAGGRYPADRVARIVKSGGEDLRGHGTADMPAWGDVFKKTGGTEEESAEAAVQSLVRYLESIQQAPPKPASPSPK